MPARQSMMVELVGRDDLSNAIALNSAIFNGARIIGPAVAGIVMANVGAGAAFFINGLSFIAVIYGLFRIDAADKPINNSSENSILSDATEGIKYIFKTPVLYVTLLLVMILSAFTQNFNTLIPALAKDVLKQEEMGYGFLMSAMGMGAFIAALAMAIKSRGMQKYLILLLGGFIMSLFTFIIGLQNSYILSSIFLMIVGWGMVTFNACANSTIQINSPDKMRGRIMSAYAFATGGMTPIGSMYAGYTAQKVDTSFAFKLSGIIGIFAVIVTAIYYRKISRSSLKVPASK
jgi:MFS family permease